MNTTHAVTMDDAPMTIGLIDSQRDWRHGASLRFVNDGLEVKVLCSFWTGMEKIWVNGQLKSQKRSFGFNTPHYIELDDRVLEVIITTHTDGGYISVLGLSGDRLVFRGSTRPLRKSRHGVWWGIGMGLLCATLGAFAGFFGVEALISLFQ